MNCPGTETAGIAACCLNDLELYSRVETFWCTALFTSSFAARGMPLAEPARSVLGSSWTTRASGRTYLASRRPCCLLYTSDAADDM
eukprot:14451142-Alexandrium_andersonii.AAC.1